MASKDEFEVDVRDVEYQRQAGKAWLARIYQPKGTGPFPTIIDVHGGAWHNTGGLSCFYLRRKPRCSLA
jgi:acetyl esterase/lipase